MCAFTADCTHGNALGSQGRNMCNVFVYKASK